MKPKYKKSCEVCGERFQPQVAWQKYCGEACRNSSEIRQCPNCEEEFSRPRSHRTKYCSLACASAHRAADRRGKAGRFGNGKPKYPRSAVCAGCKQKFSQLRGNHLHCSEECSRRTAAAGRKKSMGIKHPPWGCKSKGEASCRSCGYPATHLHHIVPRSKTTLGHRDMRNGLPLCRACHYGWHHQTVVIYRDCLTDEERSFAVELTSEWWVDHRYPTRPYDPSATDDLPLEQQIQIVDDCGGLAIAVGGLRRG